MGGKKKKKKDVTSVVWYATRIIEFLGRRTQIILKNKDTRCSLVPLCNALLLGEKITLSLDIKVSESLLIYLVQSYLLSQMQLEQNLELSESNKQVLGVLPKLPGSLYFDVTFGRCKDVNFFAGPSANLLRVQDQIYVLLNDLSLLSTETDVVWERLTEENGDGLFVDCDFVPKDSKVQSILVHGTLLSLVTDSNYLRTGVVWQTLHEVRGDGSYLDINFKRIYMGLDAAPSRDNLNGSQEETLPSGQIVNEMSLQEFSLIPGNEFSEIKTLFSDDVSLDVVDTTKIGRVFGVDLLEDIVFSHAAGFSWDGKFDLTTIFVIDEVRAEIRAPYCAKFSEEAKLNDYLSYILRIVELFRIKGVGLPAFFPKLVSTLSNPPCRPEVCNARQLEGFQRRLNCFWDIVLTTLALRSSLARTGLFSGIHRIRRFAPHIVQCQLDAVLRNVNYKGDWTCEVAESGHSFLKKVLRYIPGMLDGSNEKAEVGEDEGRQFGLYTPDAVSWKRSWRITNDQKSLDVVEPGYSAAVFSEIMVVERGTSAVVVSVVSDTVVVVVSVVSDTVVMVMPVVSDTVVQVWFRTPATFRAKAPSAAMKSESEAMVSRSTAASSTVMGSAINCVEKRICGDDDHGKRTSSPS
ncbi:hypothetical protein ACQ4PT_030308 [Festuca glaucescens]